MLTDLFKLSLNNLRRRKLRSWLTMLGIFIGIAAVIALISLGQGLQAAVTGQFASLGTNYLTVQNAETGFGPPGSTAIEKLTDHDLELVEKTRGVKTVSAVLIRMGKVEYNDRISFGYVRSIADDEFKLKEEYTALDLKAQEGRLLKIGDNKKVLLGNNYAKDTKFGKGVQVGKKIIINSEEFEVIGILKSSGNIIMNDVVVMFYDELKENLDIGDEIDLIGVSVEETEDPAVVAQRIEQAMRKDRNEKIGEEDFSVQTPLEMLSAVNQILTAVNAIVIGIAMISLVVGGIGIANTMYTSVLERKKEIGTMKAIGARNSDILWIFLIESALLGLVGGIIGVIIGSAAALGVSSIANSFFGGEIIKVNLSIPLIIFAVGFSSLIGIVSGVVPSYQASKLSPVQALRG
ncbi:MAG: ABC transporter permease [Candidatus Nanoarchaeia archaeon]|nr:ABC transporter permease [Candidatus Nanoarchaeia archaeon]MDD5741462.1 ABC transporter permease [Candidatus Nanoarchaeia archaeon]